MKLNEVLKKYNIPANFKISFFRTEDDKIKLNKSIEIKFPENLTKKQIDEISYEALNAPDDESDLDIKAINEYEENYN